MKSYTTKGDKTNHYNEEPRIVLYVNDGLLKSYRCHDRKINIFHKNLPRIGETIIPYVEHEDTSGVRNCYEYTVSDIMHHMYGNDAYIGNSIIEIYINKKSKWKVWTNRLWWRLRKSKR